MVNYEDDEDSEDSIIEVWCADDDHHIHDYYSTCCGRILRDSDTLICSNCHDHATFECECGAVLYGEDTPSKPHCICSGCNP